MNESFCCLIKHPQLGLILSLFSGGISTAELMKRRGDGKMTIKYGELLLEQVMQV
jgi:hypothetical protein